MNVIPNEAKKSMIAGSTGEIDLIVDTIKYMLCTAAYVGSPDDQFISDGAAAARVPGTTDQTLTGKVIGKDDAGDFAYFDANDPTYTAVPGGATVGRGVAYKDTGDPATSKIVAVHDLNVTTNGGDITVQFATPANGGIARFGQAA